MTVLNDADDVKVGASQVDAVYVGASLVWSAVPFDPTAAYQAEVLADSPIAYWRLEETSGSTVVDEVGAFNGTRTGATMGAAGAVGTAYSFDGVDDHLTVTTLGSFGSNIADSTIEFWIKTTTTAGCYLLGTFNDGSTMGLQIILNASTAATTDFSASSKVTKAWIRGSVGDRVRQFYMTADIYDGEWHHVALNIGASPITSGQWFVDGFPVPTVALQLNGNPDSFANFQYPISIGARNVRGTIGGFANVSLDEVAVQSTSLTSGRIAARAALVPRSVALAASESGELQTGSSWTWFHQPTAVYVED